MKTVLTKSFLRRRLIVILASLPCAVPAIASDDFLNFALEDLLNVRNLSEDLFP